MLSALFENCAKPYNTASLSHCSNVGRKMKPTAFCVGTLDISFKNGYFMNYYRYLKCFKLTREAGDVQYTASVVRRNVVVSNMIMMDFVNV